MPTESFPIVPSGAKTFGFVAVLLVLILVPMLIAVAKIPLLAPALLLIVAGVGAIVGYSAASSRRALFELSPEELRIRRSMFGKRIPRDEIRQSDISCNDAAFMATTPDPARDELGAFHRHHEPSQLHPPIYVVDPLI